MFLHRDLKVAPRWDEIYLASPKHHQMPEMHNGLPLHRDLKVAPLRHTTSWRFTHRNLRNLTFMLVQSTAHAGMLDQAFADQRGRGGIPRAEEGRCALKI